MKNETIPFSTILKKLHVGPHRKGYIYLKETLEMIDSGKCSLLKESYNILSKKYDTSFDAIEMCIRRSIREGINECTKETRIEVFGYDVEVEPRSGRNYYMIREFVPNVIQYVREHKDQ